MSSTYLPLSTGDFESWMKGLWGRGIALSRGRIEGASGRAPLVGNPKGEVFERYAKFPVSWPSSL
jgi:tetrahydromethanopterin S-methyltransferase subunit A